MKSSFPIERRVEGSASTASPIYFGSEQHGLFSWLHMPVGAALASVGLVICSPFGYEAFCSHRSLRAFAEMAAALGFPTLGFDYCGTGDSADMDVLADQLAAWSDDVVAAVGELRRRTGVKRVILMGFRFGVLTASLASAKCDAVSALIAIAPLTSGKRYLSELRMIQMSSGKVSDTRHPAGARPMEAGGFTLSAATVSALTGTDLSALNLPNVPDVLVIDRSDIQGARAWADTLSQRGARVQYAALPGFARMMMTQPHLSLVPQSMITATRDWLSGLAIGDPEQGAQSGIPPAWNSDPQDRRLNLAPAQSGDMLSEVPVLLACEPPVFGIVTEPRRGELRRRAVILLNAGATHHAGPNRMWVTLARRWAERGYLVLRIDLAGLGDGAAVTGRSEIEVYPSEAVEQIRASVEFIRGEYGITNIAVAGLCSGAYHALRAAVAKVPVSQIMMVNPLNFYWNPGITQNDLQWLGYKHNPDMYLRQVAPSKFWKKLYSGQINRYRLLKLYGCYGYELIQWVARDCARALRLPLPGDLGSELEQVAARGVDIVFVFSRGDPGIAILRHQGGSAIRRLDQRCRIHIVDGADHIFSQSGPRAALEAILTEELFAPPVQVPDAIRAMHGNLINEEQVG
ncbi:MAG: alpha/beta hydrolase [Rhodomicrobium sp.]